MTSEYVCATVESEQVLMVIAEAVEQRTISQLPDIVETLESGRKELFYSHFQLEHGIGELVDPGPLNLDGLRSQGIVQLYNRWTHQKSSYNSERAKRFKPPDPDDLAQLMTEVEAQRGKDIFCRYKETTPLEPFLEDGRIEGEFSVIVSSLFKSSPIHGIQIFREHNPKYLPPPEDFLERLDMADQYFGAAHNWKTRQINPTYFENRFHNAGASVREHGHGQLTLNAGMHEGEIEELVSVANLYSHISEGGNYFKDLFAVHQSVGLGVEKNGVKVIPVLTPAKEQELMVLIPEFNLEAREILYQIYKTYIEDIGVVAFNMAIGYRPFERVDRYSGDFPGAVVRFVDRGSPTNRTADMGSLEVAMKTSVIASNPYVANSILQRALAA